MAHGKATGGKYKSGVRHGTGRGDGVKAHNHKAGTPRHRHGGGRKKRK